MDAGKSKSRDFRLSQALAYRVVRKGSNFESVFCGLLPLFWEVGHWSASIPCEPLAESVVTCGSRLERLLVTQEAAGSSPVAPAKNHKPPRAGRKKWSATSGSFLLNPKAISDSRDRAA